MLDFRPMCGPVKGGTMETMIVDIDGVYLAARKNGIRAYNQMVSQGRSGNLPYLDELLLETEIGARENLGTIELPLKKVIGTYSAGRSTSFAVNFMPLLGLGTEFAIKWKAVYAYQLREGIQDPIKVFEFLNRFYVVEGNKRVSVLKTLDAGSIRGEVTRLVPKYDENNEKIKLYYEFLEFYKETRINNIWLTRPGSYNTMLRLIRSAYIPKIEKEAPYQYFLQYYYMPFRTILHEVGGDKLPMTTGDVFLRYFELYKLHKKMNDDTMRKRLRSLCNELKNTVEEDADLNTSPDEMPEPSLFSSLFNIVKPRHPVKIAFAYSGSVEESNWAKAHENGRQHIQHAMKDTIQTTYVDNVEEDIIAAYTVFKGLIQEGNSIIFATSPAFANAALRVALEYPNAMIYVCSEQHPSKHVHTYFGRIYEARFLTGLIAGSLTKTGKIGYVGSYPVKGVISGVNAFALGVRLVNPKAQVMVSWAYQWDFQNADSHCSSRLFDAGCDIISHQNTYTGVGFEGEYGLYSMQCAVDCGPDEYIATPVWNWGVFYEMMVRHMISGAIRTPSEARPMQFWWGLESGIVDIMYAKKYVPLETHKLVSLFKNLMKEGAYNPFTGPILDQACLERIAAGETADAKQIIDMDWFVDGIIGDIPVVPAEMADTAMTAELLEL